MTETKERLVSKIKIKCHFGTLSSKKKDHGSTKRYETMKLHQMLPTLNKYTENSEMPPEKKKKMLLPVPGDATEFLCFLIYIIQNIITLCLMLEIFLYH